jgi:UDP-N-acetylglucosamine 2-epimerase
MDDRELKPTPHRIAVVIGTRPEVIKLMPVIVAARARPQAFKVSIIRTGQHREMVDVLMNEFGLHGTLTSRSCDTTRTSRTCCRKACAASPT